MPTSTTNYGLIKPGTDDPILIGQLNDNADVIDTVLKDHSDKIDAAALGIKFKGEVNYYSNLPNDAEIGDAYTVKYAGSSGTTPDGTEYVWGAVSGVNQWINFSKDSYSKAEVDALLALKQNVLNTSQLDAVNSGIDSTKVAQIETNKNNILSVADQRTRYNLSQFAGATAERGDTLIASGIAINIPSGDYYVKYDSTETSGVVTIGIKDSNNDNVVVVSAVNNVKFKQFTVPNDTAVLFNVFVSKAGTYSNFQIIPKSLYDAGFTDYQPYAMSNAELTAAIQALQAQLANQ